MYVCGCENSTPILTHPQDCLMHLSVFANLMKVGKLMLHGMKVNPFIVGRTCNTSVRVNILLIE